MKSSSADSMKIESSTIHRQREMGVCIKQKLEKKACVSKYDTWSS